MAFFISNSMLLSGDVWVDNNRNYNDFTYQYNIDHYHLAIKEKVFLSQLSFQKLTPYIDASLGIGFNHSYSYNINSKIFEQLPPELFVPHTSTSLSYTLGAGLEKSLSSHFNMGIAYTLISWGQSSLGYNNSQTTSQRIYISNIYDNAIMLHLTYYS